MKRKEPRLVPAHSKNPAEEDFLERLNAFLAPHQEDDYRDLPEAYPTLHIVGAPRSGTTLLHQVIASHLQVGYVDNLVASFWRAPVYGMLLSKKLIGGRRLSSFRSEFGRTQGIHEPHEFGYFWSGALGYEEMLQKDEAFEEQIDWARLRLILINMAHACGAPVVFKSALLAWHIARMQAVMPKACFLWMRRDPTQTALSLLSYRRGFLGSAEKWVSLKPAQYSWLKNEPYWRQVAGQVYHLEQSIQQQVDRVGGRNVLTVDYEDFAACPEAVLRGVQELLAGNGLRPELVCRPPTSFTLRRRTREDCQDYDRVRGEVERFFGAANRRLDCSRRQGGQCAGSLRGR